MHHIHLLYHRYNYNHYLTIKIKVRGVFIICATSSQVRFFFFFWFGWFSDTSTDYNPLRDMLKDNCFIAITSVSHRLQLKYNWDPVHIARYRPTMEVGQPQQEKAALLSLSPQDVPAWDEFWWTKRGNGIQSDLNYLAMLGPARSRVNNLAGVMLKHSKFRRVHTCYTVEPRNNLEVGYYKTLL